MSRKRIVFHRDFLAPSGSGLGFRGLSPFFLSFLFSGMGHPMNSLLRMNVVETWFVAVWGLCWCNFYYDEIPIRRVAYISDAFKSAEKSETASVLSTCCF